MRKFAIVALIGVVLLAACGGNSSALRGGATTSTGGVASTDPVAGLTVTSSVATIPADGSGTATISAYAKDAKNNFVSGATVVFSSTAGGLTVTQATTDASGLATATLAPSSAATGTSITVTAATGSVTGTTTVTVGTAAQTLSVITSLPQIPSDGSKTATITALVRNAQNQFVAGVPVTFTPSSGGINPGQATTDVNGSATATLTAAGDPTNRVITLTAAAGASTATVPVSVVGTQLTLTGAPSLVQSGQGTYSISLTDSGGTGLANKTVTLTSALHNTLTPTSVTTDSSGHATFTMTAANGGNDTLTASSLGLQGTLAVSVSTQSFAFTAPAAATKVNLGTSATVTVAWAAGGVAQTGQVVSFSSTRGTLSAASAPISGTGTASVTISSTTAGPALISATGTGVSAQLSIDFVATSPTSANVQASPSTIAPQGQSTITATVRDANSNLVEGMAVNFAIVMDSTGGALSIASAITNAQGQASTVYTASTTTSATNGVQISATVAGTAVTGSATLTVGGQTVFLSLGTGNTIAAPNSTQYSMPYTVQAIDSAGNGINNVPIAFSVTSLGYIKGRRVVPTTGDTTHYVTQSSTTSTDPFAYKTGCRTEDVNGNGVLAGNNDYNGNGKLDPGLVASTDVSSGTTAGGGTAAVNIIYPKDHGEYVYVRLTATATVAGSQSTTFTDILLPVLATDFVVTAAPPGPLSPYGQGTTCANPN